MRKGIFVSTAIVTGLSVAERALGFFYRVALARMIGAEGLGAYQIALSVFGVFATVGTGGIPVSVSRLISKNKAEGKEGDGGALSAGLLLSLCLTAPVLLLFFCSGELFSFLFSGAENLKIFKILLLGLSFSCLYAVFRGWFWGQKGFFTTSVLEIAEESVMVIVGILLLRRVPDGFTGAKYAAVAAVVSYLFSFTASAVCFFVKKGKLSSPFPTFKPLAASALPITAVRAGNSLVNSAIAVLMPVMLIRAGMNESEAMQTFGVLSGMVLPVLFTPSTVIGSLSLVLVPELAEDFYAKRTDRLIKNVERGLTAATLVACVLIPFFFVLGGDFGLLAYASKQAGETIKTSCPILLPMSLTMISTSILNSMGFEKQTFLFFFIGAAATFLCIFLLPTYLGGYAYVVGLAADFLLCSALNLGFLFKKLSLKRFSPAFFKRAVTAIFLILPISVFGQFLSAPLHTFFGEFGAIAVLIVSLSAATAALYFVCGIIPRKTARNFWKFRRANREKKSVFGKI
ncbi:MAG: oligosaccharide flippase family protein [Clostridia bacterium]|nr:oligosaccharide flippase family protein [Clostridia bacterium]